MSTRPANAPEPELPAEPELTPEAGPTPQAGPSPGPELASELLNEGSAAPHRIDTANERLSDGVNRCAACGSTDIQLRASSGMLVCLFCRHEWSEQQIEEIIATEGDLSELSGTHVASGAADISPEAAGIVTLKCGGCGSEVVVNIEQATSARCHWCRHVLTINEQVPNGAVPDALLPFSLTREQAVEAIRAFAGKREFFAHRRFKEEFTPENVVGVYLPYLVIDSNASADVTGEGEVLIRTHVERDDDGDSSTTYDADVYRLERHVDFTVDDLIIESSSERADMNRLVNTNNIINAVLPFDTKNAVQWNANYLIGFTSEKRDQDVSAVQPVLEDQLLSIARSELRDSVKRYDRGVRWETERLEVHGTRWVSMYLPVWLYSHHHEEGGRGMVHYIAVNARTGETMGSVPVSHPRLFMAAAAAGIVAEVLAIAALVVA